jgi:septum formation protein
MQRKIVLASSSPRRHQILSDLGLIFEVDPTSKYEENDLEGEAPEAIVMRHAQGKAREVAARHNDAIIIGVDTLGVMDHQVLGKPKSYEEAFTMIKALQGRTHEVMSGICLLDTKTGLEKVQCQVTEIDFSTLTDKEIEAYLKHEEYLDKAAAYGIQGKAALFVSGIRGDYFNVVGLPVAALNRMLKHFDINLMDIVQ